MRELSLADIAEERDGAVPVLAAILEEKERSPEEIRSVLEALGAIDTPGSAEVLAHVIDPQRVRVPWIRAQAAFELEHMSSDHVLPVILAQLKYETDGQTVIWIAAKLARHGNYAGVDGLRVLASDPRDPAVQADAISMLDRIAAQAGSTDPDALWQVWLGADTEEKSAREEPSPRLRLAVWRCIARLGEFDLRLVDDARFALSHSAAWVVELLVEALHEKEPHIRLHVVQCLERMGTRARGACAELQSLLDEPQVASWAAAALASIGCEAACDALVLRTGPDHDVEMRTSAARALGQLGSDSSASALQLLLDPRETLDLRQVAAQSLLLLGDDPGAVAVLVECMQAPGGDAAAAESALEAWLERGAREARTGASALLERWRAADRGSDTEPTARAIAERHARRAAILGRP